MDTRGYIIIIILVLVIGLFTGMQIGEYLVLKEITELAKPFIQIDVPMLKDALYRYNNHIKLCYNEVLQNLSA